MAAKDWGLTLSPESNRGSYIPAAQKEKTDNVQKIDQNMQEIDTL
jgi:hypothetical protein